MQLTDTHFGEDAALDEVTQKMLTELIEKEKPDFVAVTGDIVSGQAYNPLESDHWWQD